MAFVVLQPEAAKEWKGRDEAFERALKDYARTRLPGFACPEWVRIVDDLPVRVLLYLCNKYSRLIYVVENSGHLLGKY